MATIGKEKSKIRRLTMAGLTTGLLALAAVGCKSKSTVAPIVGADGGDPAAANMAEPYTGGSAGGYNAASNNTASNAAPTGSSRSKVRVLSSQESYQGQASGQDYGDPYGQQGAAPIVRQAPAGYAGDPNAAQGAYNQGYTDTEEAGEQAIAETDQAPPPLPEYDQPPAPDPNYLWTPGYYDYASAGYYWVPGAWVAPPFYGALWTPPWWGFYGSQYRFHRGYWGPHVGFYGGIDYGFGYIGTGYYGGYWRGHDFFYNRSVTNVNVTNVHNVYDRTVVFNNRTYGARPDDRVSFNGGRGGIQARPTPSELGALHEAHYAPVAAQRDNRLSAASNHEQFVGANGGHPAMAFAAHPIGNVGNIGNVPREQPFNHPSGPGISGRPETVGVNNTREAAANNLHVAPATERGAGTSERGAGTIFQGRQNTEPARGTAVLPGVVNSHGAEGNAGRPAEAGHGNAGNAGQAGFGNRQGVPGGEMNGQGRPSANISREGSITHAPMAAQAAPGGRFNAGPQRQAEPAPRATPIQRTTPMERPAVPAQRQSAPAVPPEAAPAARPLAAPMERAAPQNAAPRPGPAAAPHAGGGGGGGEHGGHH